MTNWSEVFLPCKWNFCLCIENVKNYKSNHWRCSVRKGVVRNFAKFTEVCNFIKKETVLTKTRNDLKQPETTQKLPETTWTQVEFVLIPHPKVFFGQIRSQKLKFSKRTKIWYRGTFVTQIFFGKFGSKIWNFQINWNLVQRYIAICLLRF